MLRSTPNYAFAENEDLVQVLCGYDKNGELVPETDKFRDSPIDNFARNGEPPAD